MSYVPTQGSTQIPAKCTSPAVDLTANFFKLPSIVNVDLTINFVAVPIRRLLAPNLFCSLGADSSSWVGSVVVRSSDSELRRPPIICFSNVFIAYYTSPMVVDGFLLFNVYNICVSIVSLLFHKKFQWLPKVFMW